MADRAVELVRIRKSFRDHTAVACIDLAVARGEFLTLLGPSGCGKTTTLNLIAGFLSPDIGEIRLAGRSVVGEPPFRRDIGLVFQDYALFPHMTVRENIAFGLRMRKVSRLEITKRVDETLLLVQLGDLGHRYPTQLSGGQRQRVALARALVIRPTVLLLDEPLSNLDLKLREEMRLEITNLQRLLGITTILVTHDQGEALAVSDRIAVMNGGRIEQVGTPVDIYERPRSRFVAEFIGTMNFLRATAREDVKPGDLCQVNVNGTEVCAIAPNGASAGNAVSIAIRPEHVLLKAEMPAGKAGLQIMGSVTRHIYMGEATQVHVTVGDGETCLMSVPRSRADLCFPIGANVALAAAAEHCRVF